MTPRTIISNALSRLNVSQPNTQQLEKGRLALVHWWKQFSAMNCINLSTDLKELEVTSTETEIEDDDIGLIKGVHSEKYGYLTPVDLTQWIEHKNDPSYYALSLLGNDTWKLRRHYVQGDVLTLVYCQRKDFGLDDELDVGLDIEPLIELWVCKELAVNRAELYPRIVAEYDKCLADVLKNRASFVVPTREDYL